MSETSQSFKVPVLPLTKAVVFPYMTLPVSIDKPASIAAVEATLAREDKRLVVLTKIASAKDELRPENLFSIGTTAMIKVLARLEGAVQIILQGLERVQVVNFEQAEPFLEVRVKPLLMPEEKGVEVEALQREILDLTTKYLTLGHPELHLTFPQILAQGEDILHLLYHLGQLFAQDITKAQSILEAPNRIEAMKIMRRILNYEIEILQLRQKIAKQAQEKLSREQHDYLLRQQLQAIQQELGEKGTAEAEVSELHKRFEEITLPDEVRKETEQELSRLERIQPVSPDYQVILTHLKLVLELPWNEETADILSLANARQVLDEDHYGLKEIKERIIEYLAVMKLNPKAKSPILCFVGPPGVGKTSLGQSIARALGRKFERFSLGGMHDEAELRGHRRTYIGAMPGRIIQATRRAGVKNPLLMLDEVDKLGRDFRGDPAAALMEILDPAQNFTFRDNYLDLPFDLSRVLFITTANTIDAIPRPLLDRMETLVLRGYSDEEKKAIALEYLLPRQRTEAGLAEDDFIVPDDTLITVIRNYTREAGVRGLERMLGRLARKVAVKFAENHIEPVTVQRDDLVDMLGPKKFFIEQIRKELPAGVATGLAWTEAGGDVLYVEAITLPEHEKFTLTGHLGSVMKESAMTANSYVISRCDSLGINRVKPPVHIHVPAGAIPKDGPSAGVAMAAALASLYTGWPTRSDTAMTGEITLSGLVLPVGGIKEKLLAAHRAGIERVILPKENKKDLLELPDQVLIEMEFIFAETINDVLLGAISQLNNNNLTCE